MSEGCRGGLSWLGGFVAGIMELRVHTYWLYVKVNLIR